MQRRHLGPAAAKPVLDDLAGVVEGARRRHRRPRTRSTSTASSTASRCRSATSVLRAEEYLGDGLDWHSVDRVDGTPAARAPAFRIRAEGLPTPIRYGGLPADRFWEMEDAQVDLASADVDDPRHRPAAADRLRRGLRQRLVRGAARGAGRLAEHARPGGGHRLVRRPAGCSTRRGVPTPAGTCSRSTGTDDGLLILPSTRGQVGEPLETVALARDELANTAWAIEQTFTDAHGRLVDRREAWLRDEPQLARRPGETPAYAVQTVVPDYWLPLIPVPVPGVAEAIRFQVARLLQPLPDGTPAGVAVHTVGCST